MLEILYQQGDDCAGIYFIHAGKVKLYIDAVDFIHDEKILFKVQEFEKKMKQKNVVENDVNKGILEKPSVRAFI